MLSQIVWDSHGWSWTRLSRIIWDSLVSFVVLAPSLLLCEVRSMTSRPSTLVVGARVRWMLLVMKPSTPSQRLDKSRDSHSTTVCIGCKSARVLMICWEKTHPPLTVVGQSWCWVKRRHSKANSQGYLERTRGIRSLLCSVCKSRQKHGLPSSLLLFLRTL